MKTRFAKVLALALVAVLLGSTPVALAQQSYYFWWQVVDERGEAYTGQNVTCRVYRPNQHAAVLLHSAANLGNNTAANDPLVSDPIGKLHFYSSVSDPVDVTCTYLFGGFANVNRLRTTDHKIVVPRQQFDRIARFSINDATTSTTAQSSGISLPSGAVVRDVIIQNLAPRGVGTYHVSVGFGGNHAVAANVSAIVNAQALNSPDEWLRPHMVMGLTPIALSPGNHRGVALSIFHAGACGGGDGACGGNNGTGTNIYIERPYMIHVASGLDVTYAVQVGTTAGARLHVFILWQQYHTGVNRQGLTN